MDVLIPILLLIAFLGALVLVSARLGRTEVEDGPPVESGTRRDKERRSTPVRRPLSGRFGV